MSDDKLDVDDLVTGKAAEMLGEGVVPTAAVLIVQTMEADGEGIRYVRSTNSSTWQSLGMIRSAQLHIESVDLAGWDDE